MKIDSLNCNFKNEKHNAGSLSFMQRDDTRGELY